MIIKIKRIYEDFSELDGYRILIDKLWPRGISKENAKVDLWIKEIAPSNDLRKWYRDNPEKREQFQKKYLLEIKNSSLLTEIKKTVHEQKTITLLSASKDPKPTHAMILQQKLEE